MKKRKIKTKTKSFRHPVAHHLAEEKKKITRRKRSVAPPISEILRDLGQTNQALDAAKDSIALLGGINDEHARAINSALDRLKDLELDRTTPQALARRVQTIERHIEPPVEGYRERMQRMEHELLSLRRDLNKLIEQLTSQRDKREVEYIAKGGTSDESDNLGSGQKGSGIDTPRS
jgi:chromosome segregation ATPase